MKPVNGQTILITGSSDGIGKLTALQLATQQARILIHGRNKDKVAGAVTELQQSSGNKNIEFAYATHYLDKKRIIELQKNKAIVQPLQNTREKQTLPGA